MPGAPGLFNALGGLFGSERPRGIWGTMGDQAAQRLAEVERAALEEQARREAALEALRPPGRSISSRTPTISERAGDAIGALTGSPRIGRRTQAFLHDLTPVGNVDDALYGDEFARQMALLPLPGPVRKGAKAAVNEVKSLTQTNLERAGLGHLRGAERREAMQQLHVANQTPEDIARRAANRRALDDGFAQQQAAEKAHGERTRQQIANAPIMGSLNAAHRDEITRLSAYDPAAADRAGPLAAVEAITRHARKLGWTTRHTSKEGRASSRYLVAPNGREVRLSDHELPETPQREHNRGLFGTPRWHGEVVVGRDWRDHDLDGWMRKLTSEAGLE